MTTISNSITRQIRRSNQRKFAKHDARKPSVHKMNPRRKEALKGMSEAIANYMSPETPIKDKPAWLNLAEKMNKRFIDTGRGKSGKTPARRTFVKSVALARDRTNDAGHFA